MDSPNNSNREYCENVIWALSSLYILVIFIMGIHSFFRGDLTLFVPVTFILSMCFAPPNLLLIYFSETSNRKILLAGIFPMLVFFGLFLFVFIAMTTQGFGSGAG